MSKTQSLKRQKGAIKAPFLKDSSLIDVILIDQLR